MNKPFVVLRMDLLSRKLFPKEDLFRLVLKDSVLVFDKEKNPSGRGIYLRKDKETLALAKKKGILKRYAKNSDLDALFQELEDECSR